MINPIHNIKCTARANMKHGNQSLSGIFDKKNYPYNNKLTTAKMIIYQQLTVVSSFLSQYQTPLKITS